MMKKIFKILSGEPKNGDIIESIKPVIVIPELILSVCIMIIAIKGESIILGLFSLLFSWQIGWGMSITRFFNEEDKNRERN